MTKTLTKQWRNEELPIGLYYVIDKLGRETIGNDCGIRDMMVDDFNGGNIFIKEVLAPVPSYEKYVELLKKIDELEKELSDAKEYCGYSIKNREQLTKQINYWMDKYNQLEKKLAIAVKALRSYSKPYFVTELGGYYVNSNKEIAEEALKQIKEAE